MTATDVRTLIIIRLKELICSVKTPSAFALRQHCNQCNTSGLLARRCNHALADTLMKNIIPKATVLLHPHTAFAGGQSELDGHETGINHNR